MFGTATTFILERVSVNHGTALHNHPNISPCIFYGARTTDLHSIPSPERSAHPPSSTRPKIGPALPSEPRWLQLLF